MFNLFFIFNIDSIDSNSDKSLTYNRNINEYEKRKIYFKDLNSNDFNSIFEKFNIRIYNYIIDDKKYYVRNIDDLINKYTSNLTKEDKIYYKLNGIKIDGITILCGNSELLKLENVVKIH